mgnify:CR=1 FL=1
MIESYRQTLTTQPGVTIALGLLVVFAFAVFTDVLVDLAFVSALVTGLALLAAHSIELRVDGLGVEIRLGNGWRRVHVELEDVEGWQIDEAPVWGLGARDHESTRRIGLGGAEALRLHTRDGDVLVGLRDASEAAAAIDAWRHYAAALDTEDDPA